VRFALVGLAQTGKTTLLAAMAEGHAPEARHGTDPSQGALAAVRMPDPAVERLAEIVGSKKATHSALEFLDLPGLAPGSAHAVNPRQILAHAASADALVAVVRAFANDDVAPTLGRIDPAAELAAVVDEILLSDLALVEGRLERIAAELAKPISGEDRAALGRETDLLERLGSGFEAGTRAADAELKGEEEEIIRKFSFLSRLPIAAVVNVDETGVGKAPADFGMPASTPALALPGRLELEMLELDPEDRKLFMADYGIEELAVAEVANLVKRAAGLVTFYTAGPKEARAWTIEKGTTAVEAAGKIHTDLARGFIRAETFRLEDLFEHGSEKELKSKGLIRLEGKDYVVREGDVLLVRFNV